MLNVYPYGVNRTLSANLTWSVAQIKIGTGLQKEKKQEDLSIDKSGFSLSHTAVLIRFLQKQNKNKISSVCCFSPVSMGM